MDNMDIEMSTNIDDILDPVLLDDKIDNNKKSNEIINSPNLKQQNENTSNIKVNVEKANNTDIFNEKNILFIFLILLAGLPHGNKLIATMIPYKYQNIIIINIIKAIVLFAIYYVIVKYILK